MRQLHEADRCYMTLAANGLPPSPQAKKFLPLVFERKKLVQFSCLILLLDTVLNLTKPLGF